VRFTVEHEHGSSGSFGQDGRDPARGVGVASTEAVESASRRAIESHDGNSERARSIEQIAKSLPRVAPLFAIVDAAEERRVVDRAFLPSVEDLLLSCVNQFDAQDDSAAARDRLEQIRGDALAGWVGVEVSHVDHIGSGARFDHAF
jgi:hypothetical protein